MSGLSSAMAIAEQSLQAQQAGLNVTANNIANVNTPGYSRQVAQLAEQAPFTGAPTGGGVEIEGVESIRDAVLDLRVAQETQTQSSLTTLQQQLSPVEALFSTSGGAGLGTSIDNFFGALQQLSTDPSSGAQRQQVLTAGETMASTFQQVSAGIAQQVAGANQVVVQDVSQANALLHQIAGLNLQIASSNNLGENTGTLVDERTHELQSLSGLMSFTTSSGDNGQITLTTAAGTPLVLGQDVTELTTQMTGDGSQDVFYNGEDITSSFTGGSLAGVIQARDQVLPQLSSQLDQLAGGIANAINAQNALGFTPNGSAGGNLFTPPPATGAAAAMSMATTDPNAIAASGDGTPGDNSNLLKMEGLQQQTITGGLTPDDAYASMIASFGSAIQAANTQQQASQLVLTQLQNQQQAVSGVSMDEESINLSQFQQGYEAAARVVNILDQLTQTAIDLGQGS